MKQNFSLTHRFTFSHRFYVLKAEMRELQKEKNKLSAAWFGCTVERCNGYSNPMLEERENKILNDLRAIDKKILALRNEIKKEVK